MTGDTTILTRYNYYKYIKVLKKQFIKKTLPKETVSDLSKIGAGGSVIAPVTTTVGPTTSFVDNGGIAPRRPMILNPDS